MKWPTARTVLPTSLFGRALTILLVPIVLLQLVVGLVFFQRHYLRVTDQLTSGVGLELRYAIGEVNRARDVAEARAALDRLSAPLDLELTLRPGIGVTPGLRRVFYDISGGTLAATLGEELPGPLAVDLRTDQRVASVTAATNKGALRATIPRTRLSVSNPHQLLVLMIGTSILLTAIAVIFLRNQVRPIRALAEAAEAFGKGRSLPFRPAGAEEVRRAGAAFLAMRSRIERQIEQRTQMLSGVSHDLRTPLTRMRLTLALMEDSEEARDMVHDMDQMDRMLGEFLAFARGDGLETTTPTDPFALAERVVENARRTGAAIELIEENETPENRLVEMRPGAITRAVQNLVGNAIRHGAHVTLRARLRTKTIDFVVEDDGPGIPPEDRARALSPFTRLDHARGQDEDGNVGLGLSIALDVARSHGGNLDLAESEALGGLRATLRIPR
ncbi:ATP-binding protein [Amaricoccus solimangrovi]|uniref:histidine kinase n=1 Tax=Amaricoccus solimangrovi TaxID=2589815 RepID=A0A501WKV9_9RHOB|nr:ATP-binding protein [Amaricoccus solimangrovi]TPE50139.1 HAMP domain-containing protein [Amaricoccus solimangrovi]